MTEHKAQPEKFDLRSQDIAKDKRQELLRLFSEVRNIWPCMVCGPVSGYAASGIARRGWTWQRGLSDG